MRSITFMCRSTLTHMHTHTVATHTLQIFVISQMNTFPLAIYAASLPLDFSKMYHNNSLKFYCIIMFVRSFDSPHAPGEVRGTQQGHCEILQRADWFCMCVSSIFLKMCFIHFSVWLSELLLWWWSLWLDQGQRWRPALGDNTWSVR